MVSLATLSLHAGSSLAGNLIWLSLKTVKGIISLICLSTSYHLQMLVKEHSHCFYYKTVSLTVKQEGLL